jgi:hypothetical protein
MTQTKKEVMKIELYELRLKKWKKQDFTSGQIHIFLLEEIDTVQQWFNYINTNTEYDELSIRKVSAEDTEKIISNIIQQQQVDYLEDIFDTENFTEFEDIFETNDNPDDNENKECVIIDMNISEKVWNLIEQKWKNS